LNPFYYYQNKFVPNEDTQDKIIKELQMFHDAEGSFGKEIAKRQWKILNLIQVWKI
jgi:hypothetical protein